MRIFITFYWTLILFDIQAQTLVQSIRGQIIDKSSQSPLVGANLIILDSLHNKGGVSDINGYYRIENVPVGRISIKCSYIGYNEVVLNHLELNSGKELILNVEMEERVVRGKEFVVYGEKEKHKTINDMITVSGRTFTIEETKRYAGTLNDPARMAAAFAGVMGTNDSRNDIVIRGNSPMGVLWRLEGIDIPNPNHFGSQGSTGGPISMLNNNVLADCDFITGAFPAEYGNAMAGVFDLKLRKGNNENREFTGQVGFNGAELMAEGPFKKGSRSSYLASYRYSTLDLFDKLGIHFGISSVPNYQDLSFKLNFPTDKSGTFSLFGIGGYSSIKMFASDREPEDWSFGLENQDIAYNTAMGIGGLKHKILINNKTYINTTISASAQYNFNDLDTLILDSTQTKVIDKSPFYDQVFLQKRYTFSTFINKKFSAKHNIRTGLFYDFFVFDLKDSIHNYKYDYYEVFRDFEGNASLFRPYFQWQYKPSNDLVINAGIHMMYFLFNKTSAIEPRLGIKWNFSQNQSLGLSYGKHSQLLPFMIYFRKSEDHETLSNKALGMTKSDHLVLGYDLLLSKSLRLKLETYYQNIYNVPVDTIPTAYSLLNEGADYIIRSSGELIGEGTGYNYGLELTLEKFFSDNYYFLLTTSLFNSRFIGSNGVDHPTVFNGNYAANLLLGKEFVLSRKNKDKKKSVSKIVLDFKQSIAGGKRYTPFDVMQLPTGQYEALYDESMQFEKQLKDYFRTDIKIGYKLQTKGVSQSFIFYIQNVTDHKNILIQSLDKTSGVIVNEYQLGFFPVVLYRIEF
ncbi:MAG TPA: TonB-dependent receptor [Bacteroidetes bacterium]|nr:TonB-dependent receptor [Bacteroidota bacterium]